MDELIARLKEFKEKSDKPNQEIAVELGVSISAISDWFNEKRVPDQKPVREAIENYLSKKSEETRKK